MIDTFLRNTPGQLEELRTARKQSDWTRAGQLVHKMKPSVTFMGISKVKDIVPKILSHEAAAENLPDLIKHFESVMLLACKELEAEAAQAIK